MPSKQLASTDQLPLHPGQFVRDTALTPRKISVTEAARIIGISRPGISNFLNGKVAATTEMAKRIERAFEIPAQKLLDMQVAYDTAKAKEKGAPANTKTYIPPFLAIKANAIETWASQTIPARIRLAVFLRTLVHSTGIGLIKVDFPGNDDAERSGWDGIVEASEGTPWIPEGISGWEFGTTADIKGKADDDFAKSVKAVDKDERKRTTFVFVTPRRWTGKAKWIAAAKAKNFWKDVRAYDAADIEQWLEQSLAGQAWFANETHIPAENVRSLDKCWSDWADVAVPPLSGDLFNSGIYDARRIMLSKLSKPPDGPIIVAADSVEEALAFLSQLLGERGGDELAAFRDRVLVFGDRGVLPRLSQSVRNFIPVVFTRDVERELAPFTMSMHCIVVYPRNAPNIEPDIVLGPVDYETFRKALEEMKKERDEILRLSNASGRSLTVLRRQLSTVPAVRMPDWSADHKIAMSLVPFLLVGAWRSNNEADKVGLSHLAGDRPYEELEKDCQRIVQLNDAPMWSIGNSRGVISKIDLLYAIAGFITEDDLRRYFSMALKVLGEDDPALDLPEGERWAAGIHGKIREFSSAFREGISETLVLLAVDGNNLFRRRLGMDTAFEAARIVRDLLPAPLSTRVLEAHDHDLPTYAEAAPEAFLSIVEKDLDTQEPAVLGLMRPVDTSTFGLSPSRTGLLWALEGLSWNPMTLPRAARILARLAQVEISDNWVNKPANSLESIFRSWMPQTGASHEIRVEVMKTLAKDFPDVAWKICLAQFSAIQEVGHYSHKPRWRRDGYGYGEPFATWPPILSFKREMAEMALTWKDYTSEMLSDLISSLHALSEADQTRVWDLIKAWAAGKSTDGDKAALRETIRVKTLSQRAARRAKRGGDAAVMSQAAKEAYKQLEPADLLNKHAWLFREGWVEESYDEIHGTEEIDFNKRNERITAMRTDALREVLEQRGLEGIIELSKRGKAAWQIGWLVGKHLLVGDLLLELLAAAFVPILNEDADHFSRKNLIAGALASLEDEKREMALKDMVRELSDDDAVQLFLLAPFSRSTWNTVDALSDPARTKYWSEVDPIPTRQSDENNEAVERLLKAQRPRAAYTCIRFHPEKLDARVLFRLLSDMLKDGNDKPGHFRPEQYDIETAFEHISASRELTLEQKAGLEFAYIDVLARPWNDQENPGMPNLERYVETHPELFVQAVVMAYKRNDNDTDPPEWRVELENARHMAQRSYKLIQGLKRIPGHDDLGDLQSDLLARWVKKVRDLCKQLGRGDIGDQCIGKLLSSAPLGKDGVWPCEPVRQVMEDLRSESVMRGAQTGRYNARGVHSRGEGGDQERELAQEYRNWAEAVQFTHPYVSSELLMGMVKTYEADASREDTESGIRRRLG
ncbi:MAG: hypothetical protein NTNFB01_09120 [Nitrospira sp.]